MSKVIWLHVNDVAHEAPKTTSWKMQKYVGCGSELRAPAWDGLPYGEPSCGWGNSGVSRRVEHNKGWLVVWNMTFIFSYWKNNPNIFQRGSNHQPEGENALRG